ncbi:uncharacterized protein SPAPADRAFT_62380 [Spathaspora passalidarum NRRL Y-27907]|uniref:ATPase expression protein 2, mitochondrial n=1 Tax=Spathaspora passalidarum (strain NRRL Y-27907 / 11-Y1) TaxID=619300 RepID=G3ARN0_SPAPN|nr:uncharacterized protein SPAPADRAFT_62380 [Spathaspora passalidarum NRRL Y-27907]EGW31783.1 hypothetical protein SPAPADRAFT_62380 [Spathaspora passalidarum NRRL Y-27907]
MNRKLDLAAKWFRTFKRESPYDYVGKMTPKMWILVFQIYSGGNLHLWELKSTELASIRYDPKNSRFVDSIKSNDLLADFRKSGLQVAEMGLEFHETLICSLGYEGKLSQLFNFIESVWGVDETGKIISDDVKLKPNDSRYPTMNTVISIFSSIAYNGHFFDAMKFVSEFQKSYEITGSNALDKRFFDSIFSWCDMSTKFEEDRALSYFLRQTNVKTNGTPTLNEISNDVNFDYEGFLEFVKKLKQERNQAFQQLWDIYQTDEIDFNHSIYSTYLNYLKEGIADNLEQKYYDYLSALLRQYQAYHTTSQSFNRRANLGFEPVNEKHQSVYILYQAAMKELIDIKGKSLYIGQCQPLIDEWSLDTAMKQQLSDWFKHEKLNQFKRLREKKRQEFMMTLKKEDDEDDSLLSLM